MEIERIYKIEKNIRARIADILVAWLGEDDNGEGDNYFDVSNELYQFFITLAEKPTIIIDEERVKHTLLNNYEGMCHDEIIDYGKVAHAIAIGDVLKVEVK